MIDKRFWGGAIAIVTISVAGAGALPELLLRPASSGPGVVLAVDPPKDKPAAKPEQVAAVVRPTPVPAVSRADPVAPPEQVTEVAPQPVAAAPEPPKLEPKVAVAAAPAPSSTFPPVQPVGVAAANAPDAVPPAPAQAAPANPARPVTDNKLAQPERTAQRPAKPRQNVRPAVYPMAEFLAWRR